jgi:hypothetical protein
MGTDPHESARRGLRRPMGKRRKHNGPPKEGWIWMTRDLISSPAYRSLSGNALKVVSRVLEEHMAHGGQENGQLIVTHAQFAEYGMRLASVAQAIQEAEYMGFIAVDRGIAYKGGHEPNIYRLTWFGDFRDAPPTNNWKGIGEPQIAVWKERKKQKAAHKQARKTKKARSTDAVIVPLWA